VYVLNSYNQISFGTREFHPFHRPGYLGDVDFFNRKFTVDEYEDEGEYEYDNDDEDADAAAEVEDADEAEDDFDMHFVQGGDNDHDDGGPAWDPETQPPDISEKEAIALAMANSELDQLSMWDNLVI
jgi:hypothetical protein